VDEERTGITATMTTRTNRHLIIMMMGLPAERKEARRATRLEGAREVARQAREEANLARRILATSST
jgi:hypothetical protein